MQFNVYDNSVSLQPFAAAWLNESGSDSAMLCHLNISSPAKASFARIRSRIDNASSAITPWQQPVKLETTLLF